MIEIIDKKKCCGCTACSSICPKQCILMVEDQEGFIYPSVDSSECINCGICEQVCPMDKEYDDSIVPETVVAREKRNDVLANGTSGSMFTSIMEYVLSNNGVVYGVIVDPNNLVKHVRVDSINDEKVKKIPNSKYCRSDIQGIYKQVKNDVLSGKMVCFSGTPCQVAGLRSFLMKEYDNLFLVDVICRGNPSPKFWKMFVDYIEAKHKGKIKNVRFRNKTYGYHSGTMKIEFDDGKVHYSSARANYYLRAFFSDYICRPSCYDCHFKHINHDSDLTLYDSWHAHELTGLKDDDKGYTNIIIQTEKGRLLLSKLSSVSIYAVDTLKAIELDGIMVKNSIKWNSNREDIFENLTNETFEAFCKEKLSVSIKDRVIEKLKRYYYYQKFQEGITDENK